MRPRAALALILALVATAAAPPRADRPVMVGGVAELDACLSNGRVTGLDAKGDNFLAVRSRPSTKGRELDRLGPGRMVWACDETADGAWTGVVYGPPGEELDCGVGTPAPRHMPYRGPCRSGWVASRYLTIIAG